MAVQTIIGTKKLIEINWGNPIIFFTSPQGGTQKFKTIEQAQYWLLKKWPVADHDRDIALSKIDEAMHCMGTVNAARIAFISAAKTAGFKPDLVHADLTAVG